MKALAATTPLARTPACKPCVTFAIFVLLYYNRVKPEMLADHAKFVKLVVRENDRLRFCPRGQKNGDENDRLDTRNKFASPAAEVHPPTGSVVTMIDPAFNTREPTKPPAPVRVTAGIINSQSTIA